MKILVIFTGGTIGSAAENGVISTNENSKRLLIENYYNKNGAIFETTQPYFELSENNSGNNITALIKCVKENKNNFDGIIVAHGTDSLQYSAAAVSYATGNNTVPIVFVSANHPLNDDRTNGNDNFKGAVDFILQKGGKGVFVCYKNSNERIYIHRGTRLLAHNEFCDDLFSINNKYYGIIKNGKFIKNNKYSEKADEILPPENITLNEHSNINVITAHPGMKFDSEGKIYLIQSYHSGTLPTKDKDFINFTQNNTVYLVGFDSKVFYESAKEYEKCEIIILPKITFISAYIKLWIATDNNLSVNDFMLKSLGGDTAE